MKQFDYKKSSVNCHRLCSCNFSLCLVCNTTQQIYHNCWNWCKIFNFIKYDKQFFTFNPQSCQNRKLSKLAAQLYSVLQLEKSHSHSVYVSYCTFTLPTIKMEVSHVTTPFTTMTTTSTSPVGTTGCLQLLEISWNLNGPPGNFCVMIENFILWLMALLHNDLALFVHWRMQYKNVVNVIVCWIAQWWALVGAHHHMLH